jgi:hypothetical protein
MIVRRLSGVMINAIKLIIKKGQVVWKDKKDFQLDNTYSLASFGITLRA